MLDRASRDRRRRRSGDGAHRPDAAVGDRARWLQGSGPNRGEGRAARRDALALEAAGCFSIVLEAVPSPVAAKITELLAIPTIGIGAGAGVDGQVLVWHDLLGLYDGHAPRFVKQYAQLAAAIQDAVEEYVGDVREHRFPEEVHTYGMPEEELAAFEAELGGWLSGRRVPGLRAAQSEAPSERTADGERRDDHRGERERAGDAPPRQLERRPQAEREQPERPEREGERDREDDGAARAVVGAAAAEPVVAERERRTAGSVTTNESANGSAAKPTTWRAVRLGRLEPDSAGAQPDDEAEDEVPGGAVEEGADERDRPRGRASRATRRRAACPTRA